MNRKQRRQKDAKESNNRKGIKRCIIVADAFGRQKKFYRRKQFIDDKMIVHYDESN